MSEGLALCPFCGGDAKAHTYKDDFEATRFSVECVRCPAEMGWLVDAQPWGENLATKRAETIAAWNRRATPPDMREAVEALTLPIIGIENRTAQEVFDIMSDRIRRRLVGRHILPARLRGARAV